MGIDKLKPLHFEVSGRITQLLGADSVSNKFVGINELIKNAYDADATKVTVEFVNLKSPGSKIIISDNGNGISLYDLENNWMVIGTDNKIEYPYTKKYSRKKIGQKGLGRFALQNLSKKTTLTSYPEKGDGIQLEIDWTKFNERETMVNEVKHPCNYITNPKSKKGLKLELSNLNHRWTEYDIEELEENITMIIPPDFSQNNFKVEIKAKDYGRYDTNLDQFFLKKPAFVLKADIDIENNATFQLQHKKIKKREKKYMAGLTCGPVDFTMFFYFRNQRMQELGIDVDISKLKEFLDKYGGIKLYRDEIRITGFGEPGNDWLLLDAGRINDPGKFAGNNQVLGYVKITEQDNPKLIDTTTREGIIGGKPFEDLKEFLRESLAFFAYNREEIEARIKLKTTKKTTTKKRGEKYTQTSSTTKRTKTKKSQVRFLDCRDAYPYTFYNKLEDEINDCYIQNLPNACLLLCRKMIENLTYEILYKKFKKSIELRYNLEEKKALSFRNLIRNLGKKKAKFEPDERKKIENMTTLIGKFRLDANKSAHDIMNYLANVNELQSLKINEIINIQLYLLDNIESS